MSSRERSFDDPFYDDKLVKSRGPGKRTSPGSSGKGKGTRSQLRSPSTDDRIALSESLKEQLRNADPKASDSEIARRANLAAGLSKEGDQPTGPVPEGGRPRAVARNVGGRAQTVITSSGARKVIFGVMAFSLFVGVVRDIRDGRAVTTDVVPRRVIGTLVGTFLLMILAGPAPRVARGLAVLVGFTTVAFNQQVIGLIASKTEPEGQLRISDEIVEQAARHEDLDRARHAGAGSPAKQGME